MHQLVNVKFLEGFITMLPAWKQQSS